MSNTTETYWAVDNTSLQTYAQNIQNLGGGRLGMPAFRGGNALVPYREGDIWVPKVVSSRSLTLGMWVKGCAPDGSISREMDVRRMFYDNLRELQHLFWHYDRMLNLSKRFWVKTEELHRAGIDITKLPARGKHSLYEASAKAEFLGGLDPNGVLGGGMAIMDVNLNLPDPFFYGKPMSRKMYLGTSEIYNPGDHHTTKVELEIFGPFTKPSLTNTYFPEGEDYAVETVMWYDGAILPSQKLVIDVDNFTARLYDIASNQYTPVSSKLRHTGDAYWTRVYRGANTFKLEAEASGGHIDFSYKLAWW